MESIDVIKKHPSENITYINITFVLQWNVENIKATYECIFLLYHISKVDIQ